MYEPRARRSELATPASSVRMCAKAPRSGADLVFLDLEDACAPVVKESARAIAVNALVNQDWGRVVRAVRVNGLDTPWCYGDVVEVVTGARHALDVIIVPKARSARDVWWFDVLLTQLETQLGLTKRIGLEVLIEEAEGLSGLQRERDTIDGHRVASAESLGQPVDLYDCCHGSQVSPRRMPYLCRGRYECAKGVTLG